MTADSPYKALFESFRLKHLTLKNRIISTAHAPAYAEQGRPGERYQRYHEEKARGGLAMTMFGGASSISPDSPPSFGQIQVGDDGIIPYFRAFAERIHALDCVLMCQLSHAGRRTGAASGNWLPTLAPSPVREPAHGSMPKAMEAADIRRVVRDYGAAARRCREGGLDGCELLISGHLIGQFWTPLANQRRDAYGGSLENRIRFGLEVLEEIRGGVGENFIVGIRFPADERIEGGLSEAEGIEIARLHARSGLIDYLNVSGGANWTKRGVAETVPSMAFPSARFVELAGKVRRAAGLPVLHAAGVADLATANFAVAEGHVDLVGMTRAHIADPHLVAKHLAGQDGAIRPCVGAGFCIDRIYRGGDALCLHNAATGREALLPQRIAQSEAPKRRVLIVGAGPAGLEAACISAARGHDVTVFEARNGPGGQVALAARLAWRRDLAVITDWRYERCLALGVSFNFDLYAEASDVIDAAPDVVVLATGGLPNLSTVAGAKAHAATVWDVLGGEAAPGERVLVFDDTGGQSGVSAAEYLAAQGAEVELVTPDRCASEEVGVTNHAIHLRNLYAAGVRLSPDRRLTAVERQGNQLQARLVNEYSSEPEARVVDRVVVEAGTLPLDDLYAALASSSVNGGELDLAAFAEARCQPAVQALGAGGRDFALFRIGDAVAARGIHAAVFDAARLCARL